VPRFEPFRPLRYDAERAPLCEVTAPPFDVVAAAERDRLAAGHPYNVVHIDVPADVPCEDRFGRAAARFATWVREGVLVRDPEPGYTICRMSFRDRRGRTRTISGVVGALEVCPAGAGDVLPHEQTRSRLRHDRLELLRTTQANLSAVWGLSLTPGLTACLSEPGEPMGRCTDASGVTYHVERVTDPVRCATIGEVVAATPVVLADGHHRYETARIHRAERHDAGDGPGPWDLVMAFVSELAPGHLSVAAIHRLLRHPAGETVAWADVLGGTFDTEPAGPVTEATLDLMERRGAMCLVHADGSGTLLLRRGAPHGGHDALDSVALEEALAGSPADVSYQHGVEQVLAAVRAGAADAAVLIRPVTVAQIERVAHDRVLLPPKSTFFTPKLRSGLLFRTFSEEASDRA
jgi:uncharacterized protein (DUF1015 family)